MKEAALFANDTLPDAWLDISASLIKEPSMQAKDRKDKLDLILDAKKTF